MTVETAYRRFINHLMACQACAHGPECGPGRQLRLALRRARAAAVRRARPYGEGVDLIRPYARP